MISKEGKSSTVIETCLEKVQKRVSSMGRVTSNGSEIEKGKEAPGERKSKGAKNREDIDVGRSWVIGNSVVSSETLPGAPVGQWGRAERARRRPEDCQHMNNAVSKQ